MMLRSLSLVALCLTGFACSVPVDQENVATTEDPLLFRGPPPQFVTLTVDRVEPSQPVEGRPMYLHFTLTNATLYPLARHTFVWADVHADAPYALDAHTGAWEVQKAIAPGASLQGVLEFTPPSAAPLTLTSHYANAAYTGPYKESNATVQTQPVAIRSRFYFERTTVDTQADSFLGDNDTASFQVSRNGTPTYAHTQPMGYQHGPWGDYYFDASMRGPVVDQAPYSSDAVTYTTRVDRLPYNWSGGPSQWVTMGAMTESFTGDTVRAAVSDAWYTSWAQSGRRVDAPGYVYGKFCNGWSVGLNTPCPSGTAEYYLRSTINRIVPQNDTIPFATQVVQIRDDQSVRFDPIEGYSPTFQILNGQGFGYMFLNTFVPPSVSDLTLISLHATDQDGRSTMLYVEVRPASWG